MTKTAHTTAAAGLLALAMALASQAQQVPSADEMQELMKAMHAMASANAEATPVVDFRELKALLPESLAGMKRTRASGEKSAAMGMNVSYAEAAYEAAEGGAEQGAVEVKISDMGGMGGFMAMAQASWTTTEIDKETDTGFERTTLINNFKAHEEYDNTTRSGDIQIMVAGRYVVEISGSQVSMDSLRDAAKSMDLHKLSTLKPAGK